MLTPGQAGRLRQVFCCLTGMKLGPDPRLSGKTSSGLPEKLQGIQTMQGHQDAPKVCHPCQLELLGFGQPALLSALHTCRRASRLSNSSKQQLSYSQVHFQGLFRLLVCSCAPCVCLSPDTAGGGSRAAAFTATSQQLPQVPPGTATSAEVFHARRFKYRAVK